MMKCVFEKVSKNITVSFIFDKVVDLISKPENACGTLLRFNSFDMLLKSNPISLSK